MSQAKRRRRQMVNNYNHLAPRQRPNYKVRSVEVSTAHEAQLRATAQRIRQGSKK